mmetsp:Transcript_22614/g.27231  ORF Transcript_22614/g.27231 Transcript_22614/m.27231 type:complete len:128 (-) Transcript_22614:159-542(-)
MIASSHVFLLVALVDAVASFSLCLQSSTKQKIISLRATEADCEALASRLSSADKVRNLFMIDGEELPFLRRKEFCRLISEFDGTGTPSEEALLEFWMYFGGAPPPAQRKKNIKQDKGFFQKFCCNHR